MTVFLIIPQIYLKSGAGKTKWKGSQTLPSIMMDMKTDLSEEWRKEVEIFNLKEKGLRGVERMEMG